MSLDIKKAIKYFNGDELASTVWETKYKYGEPGDDDEEVTPDDMHIRMAKEFGRIEKNYQNNEHASFITDTEENLKLSEYGRTRKDLNANRIYQLFKDFKYIIPQGSVMSQLGNNKQIGSLSNCFVIGSIIDSYGGIMLKDQELIQLMKRRGGVGLDISNLRPNKTPTSNAAKTSTGAVSFMNRFSNSTREVAQNGRRGALMLSMNVNHPDIESFVSIKNDRTKVTGANISVSLTDEFMDAVKENKDYYLRYPIDTNVEKLHNLEFMKYNIMKKFILYNDDGKEKIVWIKKIKAKNLYDLIISNAWENAEPGQIFIDRHWDYSPDSVYPEFKGITTNPCVVGDTIVKTDKGDIKISEIVNKFNNGKEFKILSYNEENGNLEFKPLFNAQKTKENTTILEIESECGEKIRLTPNHKVYTEEDGWIEAVKLSKNHTILTIK